VTLAKHDDVVNCIKGSQLCEGGNWGPCQGTSKFDLPITVTTSGSHFRALALPKAVKCAQNLCDPDCRLVGKDTTPPYTLGPAPAPFWKTGSVLNYPPDTNVRVQPCTTVADCQGGLECDPVVHTCVRHVSDETDVSCATVDLIIAPTCKDGQTSVIPVCNRGSQSAPAGVKIVVLAAGQIRSLNPSTAAASAVCLTPQVIAPGRCIEVMGCGAIANGSEIMVNPQDGLQKPECEPNNNWSIFQDGACNSAICQAGAASGTFPGTCSIPLRGTQNVGTKLLARWPLDEGTNSLSAIDVGGAAKDLAVTAGAAWPPGRLGGALLISPIGPTVAAAPSIDLGDTTALSVAFWMKDDGDSQYEGGLVSHLDAASFKGWEIRRTAAGRLQVALAAAGALTSYNSTVTPQDKNWHHVAFTWDGASGALRVYVDGYETESAAHNAVMTLGAGARPFSIGNTSPSGSAFNGAIDDVSIYRGVLSPAQIYQMSLSDGASAGNPPYGRVALRPPPNPPQPPVDPNPPANILPTCPPPVNHPYDVNPTTQAPWVQWGNKCYVNFHGSPTKITGTGSKRAKCVALGADLVSLNRQEERDFLANTWPNQSYILGLSDYQFEDDWHWRNNSCSAWSDWDPTQPSGGTAENCTYTLQSFSGTRWRDVACTHADPSFSHVCEMPLKAPAQGRCAPDEIPGLNGSCYWLDPDTLLGWSDAKTECEARGAGWDLATINTISENDFLAGMLGDSDACPEVWVGMATATPSQYLGVARGVAVPPGVPGVSDCLSIDAQGNWVIGTCTEDHGYLCEQPYVPPPPPPPPPLPQDLVRVAGPQACTGNNLYYVDDPFHPTLATLCPATCPRLNGTSYFLDYELGCLPRPASWILNEVYESDCPSGALVQWSFLVFDTATPDDAQVKFDVRTADLATDLPAASFQQVALAQRVPTDTQNCGFASTCKGDLFSTLAEPANRKKLLELSVTLTPSSTGIPAQLRDWQVTYSCPPSL